MIPGLFVTGGTGFVGRRVLDALVRAKATDVRLLVRDRARLLSDFVLPAKWQCVEGSLDRADDAWHEALTGALTVLHLASSTGKLSRATHEQMIVHGTASLLAAARRAGVGRVLYVSSVAAGFADRRHYHYAEAKRAAETLVLASGTEAGMDTLIVRPTMVFGAGSAVQDGFTRLANLPVPIVFGDGTPLLQPVHVTDLADLLVAALEREAPWQGATITVGGADTVTTEALLRRLRRGANASTRFTHVPVDPLRALLALAEPVLLSVLPFTAGQLTSFVNESAAGVPSPLLEELQTAVRQRSGVPLRGLDTIVLSSGGGRAP